MLEEYRAEKKRKEKQYDMIEGLQFGNEVMRALQTIRAEREIYNNFVSQRTTELGTNLVKVMGKASSEVQERVVDIIKAEIPLEQPYVAVWWYSVLIAMWKEADFFKEFVRYVRKNREAFSLNTQFFLYYQLKALYFRHEKLDDEDTKAEIWLLFREIIDGFAGRIKTSLDYIPYEQRNPGLVVVITEQFIEIQHGPTKTALDRCKALIENMKKEVLLINTVETSSIVGWTPFCVIYSPTIIKEKREETYQYWSGCAIPYYQCESDMPNIQTLDELLGEIRKLAPARIVAIGGSSVLANLANKMIPVVTVGLSPADLEYTTTDYQTLSRNLTLKEKDFLMSLGYSEEHVVESIFTSGLKPQTEHIERCDIGISEDTFIMAVVGGRLDQEVTDEFLNMINEIIRPDMHMVFIGRFNQYEERVRKYPKLCTNTSFLRFCEDILSRLEVCDLYVNPLRKGGGTSCVEAMYKGVPVVTVGYGDVSVNVGEEFCVKDYAEMQKEIMHYYEDKIYYNTMSEKALKRAERLLDTGTEFVRIMNEVDRRERLERF